LEIILKAKLSRQREYQNCLAQTFELTPFSINTDVDNTILLITFGLHVSMFEFVHLNPNAIFATAKEKPKPKKTNIVKKFQDVWFVKLCWLEIMFVLQQKHVFSII
jgi:hypothetical protein